MARRTAARPAARARREPSRVRAEIGAIALVVFAALTLVALVTDQGEVLHWWRASLVAVLGWGVVAVPVVLGLAAAAVWYEPIRGRFLSPGAGIGVAFLALLGLLHVAGSAGGVVGQALGGTATAALGPLGGTIALVALLVVGVVIAANRSIAELARPAIERRPRIALPQRQQAPAAPPDAAVPAAAAGRARATAAEPERAAPFQEEMRITMPETAPPRPKREPRPAVQEEASASGIAGLPSAIVAAEGVLHSKADREWLLPNIAEFDLGDAARASTEDLKRSGRIIEETLAHFNIAAKVEHAVLGPVVTRYEIKPAAGVKLSRIEALADDLALALAARTLRIEAPIPGKSVVGIEVPNMAVGLVSLRDVAETTTFNDAEKHLNVAIGRDVAGSPIVLDLAAMPHLLVAGQTGSGKSVCISAILASILLSRTPDDVRLLIGDLKRVDFAGFQDIPHLIVDPMTDTPKILNALYWVTGEMDRRYRLLARASARNIAQYNSTRTGPDRIPYVVFVIDELADLMLQSPIQVEKQITRIAQLARATGIHLVLGTQRPSVDVITGLIKANIPARIAFATASAVDSRTIIDMTGAEKLLGRGDMLVLRPDLAKPIRAQGVYVSDDEIRVLRDHWVRQSGSRYDHHETVTQGEDGLRTRQLGDGDDIDDERYDEAVEIVQRAGQASVSMLQRKMTIGFARAGRLIDLMERNGVIGPGKGPGKMREVYGAAQANGDEEG
ncbi:MAG TPA: DNA translocase FtsK [Candidatus Limnocylindria bacterium]|nr:DNA translocase FtsK [Candidatus Limnocylindria bacterium]